MLKSRSVSIKESTPPAQETTATAKELAIFFFWIPLGRNGNGSLPRWSSCD